MWQLESAVVSANNVTIEIVVSEERWLPKSALVLRNCRHKLLLDLSAGITGVTACNYSGSLLG